jgi:hypothetical protein
MCPLGELFGQRFAALHERWRRFSTCNADFAFDACASVSFATCSYTNIL